MFFSQAKNCAHDPTPGLAVQAAPVLPSHLPRPFTCTVHLLRCGQKVATASLLRAEVAEFCQHMQSHRHSASTARAVGRGAER